MEVSKVTPTRAFRVGGGAGVARERPLTSHSAVTFGVTPPTQDGAHLLFFGVESSPYL